jgi:hypothetical protein
MSLWMMCIATVDFTDHLFHWDSTNADLIRIFGFAGRLSPIAIAPLLGFVETFVGIFACALLRWSLRS